LQVLLVAAKLTAVGHLHSDDAVDLVDHLD